MKVPLPGSPVRHIVHQTIWDKASERCHKVFRQLAQGTLWLTNTPMASSMAVEAQLMAVVQNRFGIYPLVEGPARHVHPKTTTFCPVLGFTPSGRPSRAHQSQNDLGQLYSGLSVAPPVFLTCNVRNCLNALLYSQDSCSKSWRSGQVYEKRMTSKSLGLFSHPLLYAFDT